MPRASKYTDKLGEEICRRLAEGESLRSICEADGMPDESTVRTWAADEQHPFSPQYARAREAGYSKLADEILDIADDGTNDYVEKARKDGSKFVAFDQEAVLRSKLRVDTRKWLLSKMLPKVYGDKVTNEITGKDGAPLVPVLNVTIGGNAKSGIASEAGDSTSD